LGCSLTASPTDTLRLLLRGITVITPCLGQMGQRGGLCCSDLLRLVSQQGSCGMIL
jgi:hypothetical protein